MDRALPQGEAKIHNSLILLVHLSTCIEPDTDWPERLIRLLRSLDPNLFLEMGFPADWKSRPIWKQLLCSHP